MLSSFVGQRLDGSLHYQENKRSTLSDKRTPAVEKLILIVLVLCLPFRKAQELLEFGKDFEILVQLKR